MAKVQIASLPRKLSDLILDLLPANDVLGLRRLSRDTAREVTKHVLDGWKCIYAHPSPSSLSRLEEICSNGTLVCNVTKLIFLGPKDAIYHLVGYDPRTARSVFDHLNNHPWPHLFTPAGRATLLDSQDVAYLQAIKDTTFKDACEPLINAFHKLPESVCASYSSSMDQPGFNKVAQDDIISWGRANNDFKSKSDEFDDGLDRASLTMRWLDAEVFLGVLASKSQHIQIMEFNNISLAAFHAVRYPLLRGP